MPDAGLFRSQNQFFQQDVDQVFLERGAQIRLVLLYEIRIHGDLVAQEIQDRSLDAAETVVQPGNIGLGKTETVLIPLFRQPVDDRAAGIAQAHQFGTFVKRFPHRVIDGVTQDLEMQRVVHPYDLRVTARHKQAEERELRAAVVTAFHFHEVGENMPLQVVDLDDGFVGSDSQAFGERSTDQQRAQQARTARKGDGIDIGQRHAGLFQCFGHDRQDVLLVGPGCQFGNDAAIAPMDIL